MSTPQVRVGHPYRGERVDVRLPPEVIAQVESAAKQAGQTRAAFLRDLITTQMRKDGPPPPR